MFVYRTISRYKATGSIVKLLLEWFQNLKKRIRRKARKMAKELGVYSDSIF